MLSAFMSAAYIQLHLKQDFPWKQTVLHLIRQSDLGPYCLQYRLPKFVLMLYIPVPVNNFSVRSG